MYDCDGCFWCFLLMDMLLKSMDGGWWMVESGFDEGRRERGEGCGSGGYL